MPASVPLASFLLASILFAPFAASAESSAAPVVVTVDPAYGRVAGGFGEVQPIFNGNVNGDDGGSATPLIKMLNLNGARAFLQMGGTVPFPRTPGAARQFGDTPSATGDALDAAFDAFYGQDFATTVPASIRDGNGWFRNSQCNQLGYFRDYGMTSNIVFLAAPLDSSALRYPDRALAYYDAYIDAIRAAAPWIKSFSIQNVNEPNYPWWSSDFATEAEASKACVDFYNLVDTHLRETHPDVRLIGPCLAANSVPFFFAWTRPFLSGTTIPAETYNYHSYEQPQYAHLAWASLFQAEAERIGRPRPRCYCSEMAFELGKAGYDGDRFVWEVQQLFTALENPDKWNGMSWHLLVMTWFNSSNIIRYQWLGEKQDKLVPYAGSLWHLFYALHLVRGPALYASAEGDPQIRAFAAQPDPRTIALAVLNDGPETRTIRLGTAGTLGPIDRMFRIRRASREAIDYSFSQNIASDTFEMEPGELLSFVFYGPHFNEGAKRVPLVQAESYAPATALRLDAPIKTAIALPSPLTGRETAVLRLGFSLDAPRGSRGFTAILNGARIPILWSQRRRGFLHDDQRDMLFEIPVAAASLRETNELELEADSDAGHFLYASLAMREQRAADEAKALEERALADFANGVRAVVEPLGTIREGEPFQIAVAIVNPRAKAADYEVSVLADAGVESGAAPGSPVRVAVDAGGGATVKVPATAALEASGTSLRLRVESDGLRPFDTTIPLAVRPVATARRITAEPSEDDWEDAPERRFERNGVTAATRLLWSDKALHFRVDVHGAKAPGPAESIDGFFKSDCIEVFIDLGNEKRGEYCPGRSEQFFVCPGGVDGSELATGHVRRARKDGRVVEDAVVAEQGKISAATEPGEDGYRVTGRIDFAAVNGDFRALSGNRIGLDIALSVRDSFQASLLSSGPKRHQSPALWGEVLLR